MMVEHRPEGKSNQSFHKHQIMRFLAYPQAIHMASYNYGRPGAIIDMHAGNGEGVMHPELGMSMSSPRLAIEMAENIGNCEVFLCEKDRGRRENLSRLAIRARTKVQITSRHEQMFDQLLRSKAVWILVLNDPCGPSDHNVPVMKQIADEFTMADFLVVFNEGWITTRLPGLRAIKSDAPNVEAIVNGMTPEYEDMVNPYWWLSALRRQHLLRTEIKGHYYFTYRCLLLTDVLAQANQRLGAPDWELFPNDIPQTIPNHPRSSAVQLQQIPD